MATSDGPSSTTSGTGSGRRPRSRRSATDPPAAGTRSPAERRQLLGRHGEALAARWYGRAGYEVVARNWRCPEGELDLICRRGGLLVVCEVKARSSLAFGHPLEAVNRRKAARIRRLAARWIREEAGWRPTEVRLDVAAVVGGRVEVVEGAL